MENAPILGIFCLISVEVEDLCMNQLCPNLRHLDQSFVFAVKCCCYYCLANLLWNNLVIQLSVSTLPFYGYPVNKCFIRFFQCLNLKIVQLTSICADIADSAISLMAFCFSILCFLIGLVVVEDIDDVFFGILNDFKLQLGSSASFLLLGTSPDFL